METTYLKFQCEYCGKLDTFTDILEAERDYTYTVTGVVCNHCVEIEGEFMTRALGAYDAIDIWEEEFYDEIANDERRAERSEL